MKIILTITLSPRVNVTKTKNRLVPLYSHNPNALVSIYSRVKVFKRIKIVLTVKVKTTKP